MERVVINESTEDENISLERQEAMQAEAQQQKQGQTDEIGRAHV